MPRCGNRGCCSASGVASTSTLVLPIPDTTDDSGGMIHAICHECPSGFVGTRHVADQRDQHPGALCLGHECTSENIWRRQRSHRREHCTLGIAAMRRPPSADMPLDDSNSNTIYSAHTQCSTVLLLDTA
jgi:hypothetical protein